MALIAQRIVGDEHLVLFVYANVTATGLFDIRQRTATGPPPFTGQTEPGRGIRRDRGP